MKVVAEDLATFDSDVPSSYPAAQLVLLVRQTRKVEY